MAFQKKAEQPPLRAEGLDDDEVAPGLYPGEVAVEIGASKYIAVSVEPKWSENGEGVRVRAWARYIYADGRTKLTAHGQHLETSFTAGFSLADARAYTVMALAKEVALLVLGEPPVLMRDVPQADGSTAQRPVLDVSDMLRLNVSLREAVLAARDTSPAPDTAAILGV